MAAAACALSVAAAAQDARIEQIPAAAPPREVPIAAPDVRPPAQLSTGNRGDLPVQLSRQTDARAPVAQLNREPRSTAPAPQVSRGGRSAQASAALSSRKESKPEAVVRVGGKDRCDAAAANRPADCARVIETRASEFVRANPLTLSPEQRLLIDQRVRDLPATWSTAIRRIGRNDVDADANDSQTIASVALATGAPAPGAGTSTDPATTPTGDPEVLSVIQALVGGTPAVTTPPK